MPTIPEPTLAMRIDLPANLVTVRVRSALQFSPQEVAAMLNQGLRYKVDCRIAEADNGPFHDDDRCHDFAHLIVGTPGGLAPSATVPVVFEYTLEIRALNRDCTGDEIYARVTVTNLDDGKKVAKNSDLIQLYLVQALHRAQCDRWCRSVLRYMN